ncbi:hypothetical protein [Polymorphobacter fuscus]|uniref:DUF4280 domain-containing protein n=1 Tax=Sandarakinorhabdus fusca TaxID=1439888 RepID=A0A7C9GRM5_9SPHN|nr:hypothetical protein [Polymorphobacter fuscus]KAB7647944.1 hypothetical protein F9290_08335 [Polymorphobacter fuscus]MQT17271.1 hypothetical protein [Polymorphobacter fuscus]NJC08734.1 hypothetical protein [Polymorphobacter fuscus]
MPGPLVQFGAQVMCSHGGQATATAPNPRVTLGGAPSLTIAAPMVIAGCAFPPPPAANGPCVTGQWLIGTTRVTSNGQPLVVQSSASLCAPTGTPMLIIAAQLRVTAI